MKYKILSRFNIKKSFILIFLLFIISCSNKTENNIEVKSAIDNVDSVSASVSITNNNNISLAADTNSVSYKNFFSRFDIMDMDSVIFIDKLYYSMKRDSLFRIIGDTSFSIKKEFEEMITYGSSNDTLEFIFFQNKKIEYVYYNDITNFISMEIRNTNNFFEYKNQKFNSNTTFNEFKKYFPTSSSNFTYNDFLKKTEVLLLVHKGFDTEFWSILFTDEKLDKIRYIKTD